MQSLEVSDEVRGMQNSISYCFVYYQATTIKMLFLVPVDLPWLWLIVIIIICNYRAVRYLVSTLYINSFNPGNHSMSCYHQIIDKETRHRELDSRPI